MPDDSIVGSVIAGCSVMTISVMEGFFQNSRLGDLFHRHSKGVEVLLHA